LEDDKMIQTSQKPVNILIVDDDAACRKLLQMALKKSSFDFAMLEVAESIEQTVERLQKDRFDVILLDLNLPGSYGRQTLDTVAEAQPDAAVVIVSGLDRDDLNANDMGAMHQGHLSKGKFDIATLEETITEAIEGKQSRQDT
jgi:DNA-binding NarL/FixJ family response regulator